MKRAWTCMLLSPLLLWGSLALSSCGSKDASTTSVLKGAATLGFSPLEGGCWYLVMDNTEGTFLVSRDDVPTALRLAGFRFNVRATILKDAGSTCMFGTPVIVNSLEPRAKENALVDLSVSGTGTIYNTPCVINGTDHGTNWGILSASEPLLVPGLEPAFQQEGLDVHFEGAFRNDVDPSCHRGRVINTTLLEQAL